MNGQDYQNAFGKAPESFRRRVSSSLGHLKEEEKMKKFGLRFALLLAALLLLLAGAVYAASREWKILDFVTGWYMKAPVGNLEKAMRENKVHESFDMGEYTLTLEEAVADGRYVYVSANVRMKNGEAAYLLPMNLSSSQKFREAVGIPMFFFRSVRFDPIGKPQVTVDKIAPEAVSTCEDTRSYREAAAQEGKRLISVGLWFKCGSKYNRITSFTALSDGSISFVLGSNVVAEEKLLDMELYLYTEEIEAASGKSKDSNCMAIPLTLPVLPVTEKRTVELGGMIMEGTDVAVDRIDFYLTPLTLHYEVYYSHPPKVGITYPYLMDFLNEKGKLILLGLNMTAYSKTLEKDRFVQIGSLLLDQIPSKLVLRIRSIETYQTLGQIELAVK